MQVVRLFYQCARCTETFSIPSSCPPEHIRDLITFYLYNTPAPGIALSHTVDDHIIHECTTQNIGIADFIGYSIVEVPDEEKPKGPHLVKG